MRYELTDKSRNQTFSVLANGHRFDFRINSFRGSAYVSVLIDDMTAVSGKRIISGCPILDDGIADSVGGNFMFVDIDEDTITTSRFDGISCYLEMTEL